MDVRDISIMAKHMNHRESNHLNLTAFKHNHGKIHKFIINPSSTEIHFFYVIYFDLLYNQLICSNQEHVNFIREFLINCEFSFFL